MTKGSPEILLQAHGLKSMSGIYSKLKWRLPHFSWLLCSGFLYWMKTQGKNEQRRRGQTWHVDKNEEQVPYWKLGCHSKRWNWCSERRQSRGSSTCELYSYYYYFTTWLKTARGTWDVACSGTPPHPVIWEESARQSPKTSLRMVALSLLPDDKAKTKIWWSDI